VHPKKVRTPSRKRLPDVRTDEDCRRLIATLQQPVYRGCFALIYAYGLRIHEAVALPVSAVDSQQMVLHVIGKRNVSVRDSQVAVHRGWPERRCWRHECVAARCLTSNGADWPDA